MIKNTELSQDELKEILSYDPETGDFRWLKRIGRTVKVGELAGSMVNTGYKRLRIYRVEYLAHRLAFKYMTGNDPIQVIDHIDGNKSNNAWANLREATYSENMQNRKKAHKNNKIGLLGVSKDRNMFHAQISINGVKKHLGNFFTKEDAHNAYLVAKREGHKCSTI